MSIDAMMERGTIMTVFRGEMIDGCASYTEQDGDVSYNETCKGTWELRSSNFPSETKVFLSYGGLEEFMLEYFELEGIIVLK